MSVLLFMPWCKLDRKYHVGDITLLPYSSSDFSSSDIDPTSMKKINSVLSSYRNIKGVPIHQVTLLSYKGRPVLGDLSDEEISYAYELADLVCFAGLANRVLFNAIGSYSNSDCFRVYGQKVSGSGFISVTSRRRDGETWDLRQIKETIFTAPVHVQTINRVSIDESLLSALVAFRSTCPGSTWVKWQNVMACFNQANTDNESVRFQVEWVLFCSAFEHILEAKPDYKDVARKFQEGMTPETAITVETSKRRSTHWKDITAQIRYEWMKEFYGIRGDFAHGKLATKRPAIWSQQEHLVLAAIGFPLLVKSILKRAGHYELTDDDTAQINSFERLADEDFMNAPPDQSNSMDSVWSRLLGDAKMSALTERAMRSLEAKGMFRENDPAS